MAGTLESSGLGEEVDPGPFKSTDDMRKWCRASNEILLGQLRECEQGAQLLEMARNDAKKGWLTQPQRIEVRAFCGMCLHVCCCVVVRACVA